MIPRTVNFFSIAIATFIPWLILTAALSAALSFPRLLFVFFHYVLAILLFGIAFAVYYKAHQGIRPFTVSIIAMFCLLVYEVVYLEFFYEGPSWFLTYIDWFVPVFLIVSVIYFVGSSFSKN